MATSTIAEKKERQIYSERTQISLSPSQKERIKFLQETLGISMSEVIRQAIDILSSSLEKDKSAIKAILRKTSGAWKNRKFDGIEYEKKIRQEEEKRLKEMGIG